MLNDLSHSPANNRRQTLDGMPGRVSTMNELVNLW